MNKTFIKPMEIISFVGSTLFSELPIVVLNCFTNCNDICCVLGGKGQMVRSLLGGGGRVHLAAK